MLQRSAARHGRERVPAGPRAKSQAQIVDQGRAGLRRSRHGRRAVSADLYGLLIEMGEGETPEEIVLRDPSLLGCGLLWTGLVAAGVYLH